MINGHTQDDYNALQRQIAALQVENEKMRALCGEAANALHSVGHKGPGGSDCHLCIVIGRLEAATLTDSTKVAP